MFPFTHTGRRLAALAPALIAAATFAGPAHAEGTQSFDTTVQLRCTSDYQGEQPTGQTVELRVKGTIPATTSLGELMKLTDASATMRLVDDVPSGDASLRFLSTVDRLVLTFDDPGIYPVDLFSFELLEPTYLTGGGYGPLAIPKDGGFGYEPEVRTSVARAVDLRVSRLQFAYWLLPDGVDPDGYNDRTGRTCQPIAGTPPIATVAHDATAPAPPAITSLSPTTGPVPGGNTVTIKGSGFATGPTPFVGFGVFTAGDVVVVDDQTLTVTAPENYFETTEHVWIQVGSRRTEYDLPQAAYHFAGPKAELESLTPSSGRPGDVITVRGTNLDFTQSIDFMGSTYADSSTIVHVSPTELRVTVPYGGLLDLTRPLRVRLHSQFGTSTDTPADDFTQLAPLAGTPAISEIRGTAFAGVGGVIRLRGTNFKGVRYVTIGRTRVKPLLVAGTTDMFVLAPPLEGTWHGVTVTNRIATSSPNWGITYRVRR